MLMWTDVLASPLPSFEHEHEDEPHSLTKRREEIAVG